MSVDFTLLKPVFSAMAQQVLDMCARQGLKVKPVCGLRTALEQARDWRKGRTAAQINSECETLTSQTADYLALCIKNAGPQNGNIVTHAIPGTSYHQFGEALDVIILDSEGQMIESGSAPEYRKLQEIVKEVGLFPVSGDFDKDWTFDAGHIQFRPQGSPTQNMTIQQIDTEMKSRFG